MDISGSLTEHGEAKWNIAREAVRDLLTQSPETVPIAKLTFADGVRDVFNFSQSREAIAEWLNGAVQRPAEKFRKTALFDAILEELKQLGLVQLGDAMYAITDGGDNDSPEIG